MTQGGPSQPTQNTEKLGRGRPLAAMACALRGGHDYVPSRRFEGYDTCVNCAHRRLSIEGAWFSQEGSGDKRLLQSRHALSDADMGLRPLGLVSCVIRRGHSFVPSRRKDGYETCTQCGYRRKSLDQTWFAAAPTSASIPEKPPMPLEPSHQVIVPFAAVAPEDAARTPLGVDPKVLKRFLSQIDRLD